MSKNSGNIDTLESPHFVVVYRVTHCDRTGGAERFEWRQTVPMQLHEARASRVAVENQGYKAYVWCVLKANKGLPTVYDPETPDPKGFQIGDYVQVNNSLAGTFRNCGGTGCATIKGFLKWGKALIWYDGDWVHRMADIADLRLLRRESKQ